MSRRFRRLTNLPRPANPSSPEVTRRERAASTVESLRESIPAPQTELVYRNEYELIVAVILSAQCTDERVNKITPGLFEAFPTVESMALAEPEDIFPHIKSVSYPNNKAKHLAGMARLVVSGFGGKVPGEVDDLVKLPGVGRKTAQVVAAVAFEVDAMPVDTHVFRVANRIGLVKDARTPLAVEQQLKRVIPRPEWSEAHHLLILHGRYTCIARSPKCDVCPLTDVCLYFESLQKLPPPVKGLDARRGKYWCRTSDRYFDEPVYKKDRYGVLQIADPVSGSMTCFETRTGRTTRKVRDFRV
jgi:endonuclease III